MQALQWCPETLCASICLVNERHYPYLRLCLRMGLLSFGWWAQEYGGLLREHARHMLGQYLTGLLGRDPWMYSYRAVSLQFFVTSPDDG